MIDPDALCCVESVEVAGEAFAQHGSLFLEVTLRAAIVQPCSRCLEPVNAEFATEEEFDVTIPPGVETVDLTPTVLRLVLSAYDPNVRCKTDCRGLCPVCGTNLNEHPDHVCEDDASEPTRLRDLLS